MQGQQYSIQKCVQMSHKLSCHTSCTCREVTFNEWYMYLLTPATGTENQLPSGNCSSFMPKLQSNASSVSTYPSWTLDLVKLSYINSRPEKQTGILHVLYIPTCKTSYSKRYNCNKGVMSCKVTCFSVYLNMTNSHIYTICMLCPI